MWPLMVSVRVGAWLCPSVACAVAVDGATHCRSTLTNAVAMSTAAFPVAGYGRTQRLNVDEEGIGACVLQQRVPDAITHRHPRRQPRAVHPSPVRLTPHDNQRNKSSSRSSTQTSSSSSHVVTSFDGKHEVAPAETPRGSSCRRRSRRWCQGSRDEGCRAWGGLLEAPPERWPGHPDGAHVLLTFLLPPPQAAGAVRTGPLRTR